MKHELKTLQRLRRLGKLVSIAFNLPLRGIYVNESLEVEGVYAWCYFEDKLIELRLKSATGRYYKFSTLLMTLAHELAHLAEAGHGIKHRQLAFAIHQMLRRHR